MSKKILLADDSITIQKVIELTFSDEDFEVVTVGNGRLALEKLADVRPDIVLCDIVMPEKDGYEVCQRIKSDPQTAHIPVLLLTGAFEPFDQEKAARVGSDGFLAKPFEPETLIAKVKDLLTRGPARTAPTPVPPPAAPRPEPPSPPPAGAAAPPPVRPAVPRVAPPPVPPVMPTAPAGPPESAPPMSSFVPEEPFDAFDAEAIEEPEGGGTAEPPLAPVSEDESATLRGEPGGGASAAADAASTVMFRPSELPWTSSGSPRAEEPPVPAQAEGAPLEQAEVEPEPFLTVEPAGDISGGDQERAAFEEVLEDDLDFGGGREAPPLGTEDASTTVMFEANEPSEEAAGAGVEASTGRFRAPVFPADSPTATKPPLAPEPAPPPPRPPSPVPPAAGMTTPFGQKHAAPEREPAAFERPAQASGAKAPPAPVSRPEESFSDIGEPAAEFPAPSAAPSEAASVPVPVDMVERIAQRVAAQVSEKVVREVAWEVIPDLAEALIKQEIERLKAELQKL